MRWVGLIPRMEERRPVCRVLVGKPEGRDHLENPGIDGRVILRWIFRKYDGGMDRIDLAQDCDRWWAFVNAVMNHQIP